MLIESFTAKQTAKVCPAGASVVRGQPVIGPPVLLDCCRIAMLFLFFYSLFNEREAHCYLFIRKCLKMRIASAVLRVTPLVDGKNLLA